MENQIERITLAHSNYEDGGWGYQPYRAEPKEKRTRTWFMRLLDLLLRRK